MQTLFDSELQIGSPGDRAGCVPAESTCRSRILVADNTGYLLRLLAETMRQAGHDVIEASTVLEALSRLDACVPDAAILDRVLDKSALEVADRLASLGVPFVFLTAAPWSDCDWGVHETAPTLRKPAAAQQIVDAVGRLLE